MAQNEIEDGQYPGAVEMARTIADTQQQEIEHHAPAADHPVTAPLVSLPACHSQELFEMSHPEHGQFRPDPEPASAGHEHGTSTQSPPPDAHDPHAGHGEYLAHLGPGEHPGHGGHDRHAGHGAHGEMFRRRFWVSLVLAVPVVFFSHMFATCSATPCRTSPAPCGSPRCWAR